MQPFDVACLVGRPRHVDMADQREHPPCALSLHRSTNSVCASHLDGSLARRAKIHVGLQQTPLKLATLLDYIALQLRVRGSHHLGRRQALLHDRKMPSRGPECIELFNLPASFHQGHLREIRPNGQRTDSDTLCFSMDRCVAMDPHPTEYDKDPAAGTKTRPDADNSKAAIDVKSVPDTPNPDGSPRKVYNSEQLGAQRKGADADGKDHGIRSRPYAAARAGGDIVAS
jgi:hypothetical protein